MSKFKIGDLVVGNDKSNERYFLTAKKNDFIGKVINVYINGDIDVKIIKIRDEHKGYRGDEFLVNESYFDLLKETEQEPEPERETENSIPLHKVIELIEDDEMLSGRAKRHLLKKLKDIK